MVHMYLSILSYIISLLLSYCNEIMSSLKAGDTAFLSPRYAAMSPAGAQWILIELISCHNTGAHINLPYAFIQLQIHPVHSAALAGGA